MAEVKRSTRRASKKYLKIKARSRRKHLKTKNLLGEISECNEIKEQLLVRTSEFEGECYYVQCMSMQCLWVKCTCW